MTAVTRTPLVVLTGFGPFPGVAANASALLVPELACRASELLPWARFHHEILPTEWRQAPARAAALIKEQRPAVLLHFGVSSRARALNLETRGRNSARMICDDAGQLPEAPCFVAAGPEILLTDLPVAHIAERLRSRRVPAVISRDAGGYLCNAVLYRSLYEARHQSVPARVGFVHLPSSLRRRRSGDHRGLSWEQAISGSLEIIAAGLGCRHAQRRPLCRADLRGFLRGRGNRERED